MPRSTNLMCVRLCELAFDCRDSPSVVLMGAEMVKALFEATAAELGDAGLDDIFKRFSRDALVDKGYEFDEQPKLVGILFTRSFRQMDPSELSRKVVALYDVSRSASDELVHRRTRQALSD